MMNMKTIKYAAAVFAGGAMLTAGVGVILTARAGEQTPAKTAFLGLTVDEHPLAREARSGVSYAEVLKKVMPEVVQIDITTAAKETTMSNPGLDNPFFRQFFGQQFGSGRQKIVTPPEHGLGSGVIVTKDGYILTNDHVVDDADKVKVTLQDGREFTAKVIGKDPDTDVAVVKIDAKDLPAISLADSSQIEVGDVVLAVGNPFGLSQTVTMGIVSATGRAAMGLKYQDFIQTDAAINPGNSGGALVDTDGRLIGINTAIYSRSGGNQGIGFAIPTDLAREVMVSLVKTGKVTRGQLGVHIQDITPPLARQFDLKNNHGALITDVEPNTPAAKAGLESGDVILQFNGKPVVNSLQLRVDVGEAAPGEKVPVEVWRDGSAKTVEVVVNQLPAEKPLAKNDSSSSPESANDTLQGVGVTDLNAEARQQFSVPPKIKGAVVTEVDPASAAAEAGLKPGDVIMEINKHSVKSADDAVKLTTKAKDRLTLLHVWRNDGGQSGSQYLVVDESKAG
jgi:serine protease Do